MKNDKISIAIVSPNFMQTCGLKAILLNFFPVNSIDIFEDFQSYNESAISYNKVFIDSLIYLSNSELCKDKKRIVLLSEKETEHLVHSELTFLNTNLDKQKMVNDLNEIWKQIQSDEPEEEVNRELSDREKEVLELVAKGCTSKEIATMLNISQHTVHAHRKKISEKLGIKSVSALTVYAMMNGIVSY